MLQEHVILVPGLFGFASFGRTDAMRIEYFEHVKAALVHARPDLAGHVHVHDPPPTGTLASRVKGLFAKVLEIIGEETVLAGGEHPAGVGAPRVHLIGHSTGGLDARLLTNVKYHWSPCSEEQERLRASVLAHIGTVVTVSSPLQGTPFAARLGPVFQYLVDALSLSALLDAGRMDGSRNVSEAALLALLQRISPWLDPPALRLLTGLDRPTVLEVQRFRGRIASDASLMEELQPMAMARLNEQIEGGDWANIRHFVSVSPAPDLGHLDGLARRLAYAVCYRGTFDAGFEPRDFPAGDWMDGADDLLKTAGANDGVVPAASQTLDGAADGIVLGDHLDVIGHAGTRGGTMVLKSGARFSRKRFVTLWSRIGDCLSPDAKRRPLATMAANGEGVSTELLSDAGRRAPAS